VNNVCREVGMMAFSCGMNTAFVPNDAQTAQLQAACGGKSAGDACSVDFGSQGVYAGSCRSAQGAMTCIQPNLCMAVGGRTSLANPRGICLDTCKSIPELCKS